MSKKIFFTKLTPKTPSSSNGSSFILAILVGITFGFSFACLFMNFLNYEPSNNHYRLPPSPKPLPQSLPSQIEYSKIQQNLKNNLYQNFKNQNNLFDNSRILQRPLNPINIHQHSKSKSKENF